MKVYLINQADYVDIVAPPPPTPKESENLCDCQTNLAHSTNPDPVWKHSLLGNVPPFACFVLFLSTVCSLIVAIINVLIFLPHADSHAVPGSGPQGQL